MTAQIQPNAFVTLDYTLKDESGGVLDESQSEGGEPIKYIHGYGMLVPGLEAGLVGMKPGDHKDIVVAADAGFGERDEDLVLEIDRGEFPDPEKITPGDEFIAESPDGDEVVMRVVALKPDAVVVDANHPLAGQTLHYSVTVREVRDATSEELETAAAAFEEAEHEHDESCGHGPEGAAGAGEPGADANQPLTQLGKKKKDLAN